MLDSDEDSYDDDYDDHEDADDDYDDHEDNDIRKMITIMKMMMIMTQIMHVFPHTQGE